MKYECKHLDLAAKRERGVAPSDTGCKECLELGGDWVHLRLCLTCGHVGCCDNSPNKHATKHYHSTKHPVIRSFEPGEDWGYCYPDDVVSEALPAHPDEEAPVHYDPP
ncbi:MAG TPA: UBP-type zinc finger domain-containing protein [Polyangiaceae bacterium]|nr:UBP-type zinc finger domain-containing protein [Polyangiaceae bacterium]